MKLFDEVFFGGELWLSAGAALGRAGDLDEALAYLTAASRSTMYLPCYYVAHRLIEAQVRTQLGDDQRIAAAVSRGKALDLDNIAAEIATTTRTLESV